MHFVETQSEICYVVPQPHEKPRRTGVGQGVAAQKRSGGSPRERAPALDHKTRRTITATQRIAATSTLTMIAIRRDRRMTKASGPRRAANPKGCGVGPHRTDKPPFTGASARPWLSRSASGGPRRLPVVARVGRVERGAWRSGPGLQGTARWIDWSADSAVSPLASSRYTIP